MSYLRLINAINRQIFIIPSYYSHIIPITRDTFDIDTSFTKNFYFGVSFYAAPLALADVVEAVGEADLQEGGRQGLVGGGAVQVGEGEMHRSAVLQDVLRRDIQFHLPSLSEFPADFGVQHVFPLPDARPLGIDGESAAVIHLQVHPFPEHPRQRPVQRSVEIAGASRLRIVGEGKGVGTPERAVEILREIGGKNPADTAGVRGVHVFQVIVYRGRVRKAIAQGGVDVQFRLLPGERIRHVRRQVPVAVQVHRHAQAGAAFQQIAVHHRVPVDELGVRGDAVERLPEMEGTVEEGGGLHARIDIAQGQIVGIGFLQRGIPFRHLQGILHVEHLLQLGHGGRGGTARIIDVEVPFLVIEPEAQHRHQVDIAAHRRGVRLSRITVAVVHAGMVQGESGAEVQLLLRIAVIHPVGM